ncbi:MAG TPA: Hsp20/alpha crystallin family protein [Candidatus Anaerotignum merdipullorum]|nr:Hsp20/alpha crystallin family protein [Candidatus Anaerotignum merdipullorum]
MLMHGMFGDRLFDDAFWEDGAFEREFFGKNSPMYAKSAKRLMNTDVVEQSDRYEVKMDLPGFHKEDIQVHLENGYLTVSANKNINQDEKDENGKFLRQERYSGSLRRSFYVGNTLMPEDIQAKYETGVLILTVPKKQPEKIERNGRIAIEGGQD